MVAVLVLCTVVVGAMLGEADSCTLAGPPVQDRPTRAGCTADSLCCTPGYCSLAGQLQTGAGWAAPGYLRASTR